MTHHLNLKKWKTAAAGVGAILLTLVVLRLAAKETNTSPVNQSGDNATSILTQISVLLSGMDTRLKSNISHNWHTNISTTVFWIGEEASDENGFIANTASAWDEQWQEHYGGVDDPSNRRGYYPKNFIPLENPFYIALPYNDLDDRGHRKASANLCLEAYQIGNNSQKSWCKDVWVAVRYKDQTAYGQWEDVGPYNEDDTAYVFGGSTPKNIINKHAGLDVSPAIRDFLGLSGSNFTDWQFVSFADVPDGPWKEIITK